MNVAPIWTGRLLVSALMLGAVETPLLQAQNNLSVMAELCWSTQPEWTDAQRDSAQAAWAQWQFQSPPHSAEALAFLTPDQQFALERYQAQFGWPHDSTEWRALPLNGRQRELLQRLYHGVPSGGRPRTLRGIEPALAAGWSCSGCPKLVPSWGKLSPGARLALVGPNSRWSLVPWVLKSPYDAAVRGFWDPEVWGVALHPGRLPSGAPGWARSVERIAVSRGPSSGTLAEVSVRSPTAAAALSASSQGWWLVQGTWYAPGGLWVSVQRERYSAPDWVLRDWERPAASATPWRAQRGNRATAALPLWAGRLSLAQTSSGPSATWANALQNVSWTPGQLAWGQSLQSVVPRRDPEPHRAPHGTWTARGTLYLGRAQGASLQLRQQRNRLQWEIGLAALTAREEVLPRALGPMSLWRPGVTAESAVVWLDGIRRASLRLRCAPSGWSAGLSAQWDLPTAPHRMPRETESKSLGTTWLPPQSP